MSEIVLLLLPLSGGLLLGGLFYGGLWWTVHKGLGSPRPALWFLASYLVRTGIVLAGFRLLAGDHWPKLLVCLLGFLMVRFITMRQVGTAGPGQPAGQTGHAA